MQITHHLPPLTPPCCLVTLSSCLTFHYCSLGLSQNVLAVCTFDLQFSYVLPGWKGSAADGSVFDNACQESLAISPGTYLLADARFPTCDTLIILYKGE